MYLINLLDSIMESDLAFFTIVGILLLIALFMAYLIFAQNKEYMLRNNRIDEEVNKVQEESEVLPNNNSEEKSANDEMRELQDLTVQLQTIPKEKIVEMTPYEEEQEENAIISYDELVSRTMELPQLAKQEEKLADSIEINYDHEEKFLEELKKLRDILR